RRKTDMFDFLSAVANLGTASQGFSEADRAISERDQRERSAKLNDMLLRDALRKDDIAAGARSAMDAVRPRAAVMGLNIPEHLGEAYDEEYRPATKEGFDVPGGVDLRGKTQAAADYYANRGELDQAEKMRKSLDA